MKKKMIALLLLACLCLSLAACAKTEAPAAEAPAQTQPAEAAEAPAQPEEAPAEEAPAADQTPALSGKVTVYMPSPAGLADKLAALFTEKTGVEVEQFQGTTGEILARLEAEQALVQPVRAIAPGHKSAKSIPDFPKHLCHSVHKLLMLSIIKSCGRNTSIQADCL